MQLPRLLQPQHQPLLLAALVALCYDLQPALESCSCQTVPQPCSGQQMLALCSCQRMLAPCSCLLDLRPCSSLLDLGSWFCLLPLRPWLRLAALETWHHCQVCSAAAGPATQAKTLSVHATLQAASNDGKQQCSLQRGRLDC